MLCSHAPDVLMHSLLQIGAPVTSTSSVSAAGRKLMVRLVMRYLLACVACRMPPAPAHRLQLASRAPAADYAQACSCAPAAATLPFTAVSQLACMPGTCLQPQPRLVCQHTFVTASDCCRCLLQQASLAAAPSTLARTTPANVDALVNNCSAFYEYSLQVGLPCQPRAC